MSSLAAAALSASGQDVDDVLRRHLSGPNRRVIMESAARRSGLDLRALGPSDLPALVAAILPGLRMFASDATRVESALANLLHRHGHAELQQDWQIDIQGEADIVRARSAARDACREAGVGVVLQTKLVTVVSELARNIHQYAGGGTIAIQVLSAGRPGVRVEATDDGPGISNLDAILSGRYRSRTGMGAGLRGAKRIMDEFVVDTAPGEGTRVRATKWL